MRHILKLHVRKRALLASLLIFNMHGYSRHSLSFSPPSPPKAHSFPPSCP
ncbi:hypothetical protein GBA52_020254 [Prunus armeniaca]|nr:hypothetical protein GBA52_020254 [Prunus armeniaca]